MKLSFVLVLVAAAMVAGCGAATYSDPSASPDTSWNMGTWSQQRQCDLGGGYWNRTAGVCEMDRIR